MPSPRSKPTTPAEAAATGTAPDQDGLIDGRAQMGEHLTTAQGLRLPADLVMASAVAPAEQ